MLADTGQMRLVGWECNKLWAWSSILPTELLQSQQRLFTPFSVSKPHEQYGMFITQCTWQLAILISHLQTTATASYSRHLRFKSWQKTGYHDKLWAVFPSPSSQMIGLNSNYATTCYITLYSMSYYPSIPVSVHCTLMNQFNATINLESLCPGLQLQLQPQYHCRVKQKIYWVQQLHHLKRVWMVD